MAAPHAQWYRGARVERGWGRRRAGPGPSSERTVEDMRVHEQTLPALRRRVTAIKRNNRKQPTQLMVQSEPLKPKPMMKEPEMKEPDPPAPPTPQPTPGRRDDHADIPYHALLLPVLGSLVLTIGWGYELYLTTPSLQSLVNSFCVFRY